jgi:hypothetical protein
MLKKVFVLKIDSDHLSIFINYTPHSIGRKDIRSISLTGRKKVYGNPTDALIIEATDGQLFTLADQLCRNMPDLKQALLNEYAEIVTDAPVRKVRPNSAPTGSEAPQEFSGNFLLSVNGILLLGITIAFTWMGIRFYSKTSGWINFIFLLPIIISPIPIGWQFFYFRITNGVLEVRNHLFLWYKREYLLDDITGVVFEYIPKRSYALRIRTLDFRSVSYAAGSLRKKNWNALQHALKKRDIPVKNELP